MNFLMFSNTIKNKCLTKISTELLSNAFNLSLIIIHKWTNTISVKNFLKLPKPEPIPISIIKYLELNFIL
jgi:hypothetical protein